MTASTEARARTDLKLMARGLVLILTFVALGYAMKAAGVSDLVGTAWVDAEVKGRGLPGEALFLAIGAVATAAGLPRQLICFLAGYAFDVALGTALALVASVAGCVLAFTYARLLGRGLVQHRFARRIARLDAILRGHPFSMTLLLRLLPVGSNLVTNLAAGVSSVRPAPFFAGSALGYLPQTLVFALAGSGVQLDAELRIAVSVALFVVSAVIGVMLYRRYRKIAAADDAAE